MRPSSGDVPLLFCQALLQLLLLPFHVAVFLVRRRAIRAAVRQAIEAHGCLARGRPDAAPAPAPPP